MKCARCMWVYRDMRSGVKYATLAVTVYRGNALCVDHLELEKQHKKREGEDPWT